MVFGIRNAVCVCWFIFIFFCFSGFTGDPFVSPEDEAISVVTAICPSGCPVCRTPS